MPFAGPVAAQHCDPRQPGTVWGIVMFMCGTAGGGGFIRGRKNYSEEGYRLDFKLMHGEWLRKKSFADWELTTGRNPTG